VVRGQRAACSPCNAETDLLNQPVRPDAHRGPAGVPWPGRPEPTRRGPGKPLQADITEAAQSGSRRARRPWAGFVRPAPDASARVQPGRSQASAAGQRPLGDDLGHPLSRPAFPALHLASWARPPGPTTGSGLAPFRRLSTSGMPPRLLRGTLLPGAHPIYKTTPGRARHLTSASAAGDRPPWQLES